MIIELLKSLLNRGRIIITKDSDFQDNFLLKGAPPKILLLKLGNISNKDLFKVIDSVYNMIEQLFVDGNGMVVLSKNNITGYE